MSGLSVTSVLPDEVTVELSGGPARFHAIWLRDNAPDADTRSPQNGQRLISITDIPDDLAIRSAELAGGKVMVRFSDRDQDIAFELDWLAVHSYDKVSTTNGFRLAADVETWDQRLGNAMPCADFL